MAESSTININSYLSTASDVSGTSKSYTDKSSDNFANVFNNANKSYSASNAPVSEPVKVSAKAPVKDSADNNASTVASKDTESENVTEVKNKSVEEESPEKNNKGSQGNASNNSEEEPPTEEEAIISEAETADVISKDETEVITEEEAAATAEKFKATMETVKTAQVPNNITTIPEKPEKPEPAKDIVNPVVVDTEAETPAIEKEPTSKENTGITDINVAISTDNILEVLALNTQVADLTLNPIASNVDPAPVVQAAPVAVPQAVREDVSANLAKNNLQAGQATNVKAQAQTQQVSSDLKLVQQNNMPQVSQEEPTQVVQEVDIQAPAIEADAVTVTSDVDVNPVANKGTKVNLNKTSLSQDALDKLNVKVTNIETSSQNSNLNGDQNANSNLDSHAKPNNLPNKQDTQDQMAKLSLESNTPVDVSNNDLASMTNPAGQVSFAKTLNNAQAPTQPQAPTSKLLSDTEILSQINNKLNSFKDEGMTKVTIVLRPENLGKVNLELVNTKEGLTAQMTTDNPQVKEILDKSLNSLKDNLSSQGVSVNSVSVKVEETQKQSNSDMFEFNHGQPQAGDQESSNNGNGQNKKEFSLDEGNDNVMSTISNEGESTTESEDLVSVGSQIGKVDYKV